MTKLPTIEIVPTEPTEPGALSGWAVNCSSCGRSGGASLHGMAERLGKDHLVWHDKRAQEMSQEFASSINATLWKFALDAEQEDFNSLTAILATLVYRDNPEYTSLYDITVQGVRMFLEGLQG